jgi:squalene synthase HpnC
MACACAPESVREPARNRADELEAAYAYCGQIARGHYENFTIASWLMPRAMRRHMHAIYAYARLADDLADEERDRAKLDQMERDLEEAYNGRPRGPLFLALADTARRYDIPPQPFLDLLRAFRSDIDFKGFETLDELLEYARYSANPVGRLVLFLFGYRDEQRQQLSDLICSGLQLANFWQDVAIDLEKGRVYIPRADLRRFGVEIEELKRGALTPKFQALMRNEIGLTREMLLKGAELHRLVAGGLRRDVLMFAGGGLAILRAIERVEYDVFKRRPALNKLDYVTLGWRALCGRLAP